MGFRYQLRLADGSNMGEAQFPDSAIRAGEQIRVDNNQLVRVLAVIDVDTIGEFVDGAVYGILEIEPV
jgi:hypothetical protein